jgi:hypothetical protein
LDAASARAAIEEFRTNAPWFAADDRQSDVARVADEIPAWERLLRRDASVARLAKLSGDVPADGPATAARREHEAMTACSEFLDALGEGDVDPRASEVRAHYWEAFVSWLAATDDVSSESAKAEIAKCGKYLASRAVGEEER